MPVRVNAEQATRKWVDRLSGATTEIQEGIQRVDTAPGQKAVRKRDKWRNNLQAAEQKWVDNTGRVSLEEWKQAATEIGVPRIAQGAQAKQGKMLRFQTEFLPFLQRGVQAVEGMDDTTFEQRVQRSVAMMRHNRNFKRGGRA